MRDSAQYQSFDLSDFLPFQMAVVSTRLFQTVVAESGMQMPEWRIMMALLKNQPCSSNDLCILTAMDAARVSRAQRRLEELNMIEVAQDKDDRRRLIVQLSADGQDEYNRLSASARVAEERMLEGVSPEDRSKLKTMLADLFQQL